jgi:hypothetical protein
MKEEFTFNNDIHQVIICFMIHDPRSHLHLWPSLYSHKAAWRRLVLDDLIRLQYQFLGTLDRVI